MPEYTTNFRLIKPDQDEFYTILDANQNNDTIDAALRQIQEQSKTAWLDFRNVSVLVSAWVANSDYTGYAFRATITLKYVTESMTPNVFFAPAQAESGNFAPVSATFNGGVHIWAKAKPGAAIIISTILCLLEGENKALDGSLKHPPVINPESKTWLLWDDEIMAYMDTKLPSEGRSFAILSQYDSLEEMIKAHPTGRLGDVYAVGMKRSEIYIWDLEAENWTSIGPVQGGITQELLDGGEDGQVLVKDETQEGGIRWGTLTAGDVGAVATETDPTVPAWAKASAKPTYTAAEVGAVPTARKVNNKPLSGDITLTPADVGAVATETFTPLIQEINQSTEAVKGAIDTHQADAVAHVSEAERAKWDDAAMGIMTGRTGPVAQIMTPFYLVGYTMDVTARAVAAQAGTGTPSPANVRPITGRGTLTLTRCGKNLMTQPYTAATGLGNGVEFTRNADGSITANGTATKDIYYGIRYMEDAHITLLPGVTYLISSGVDSGDAYLYFNTVDSASTVSINGGLYVNNIGLRVSPTRVTVSKPTNIYCRLYIKSGTTLTNFTLYPMIELSPVDTAYESYTGNAYVYTFTDKVYGLPNKPDELLSAYGKLLRRTVCQAFSGAEDWAEAPEASNATTKVYTLKCATLPPEVSRNTNLLSSHFAPEDILQSTATEGCVFSDNGERLYVRVLATRCADLSAWKAYMAAQNDGGTPWQVVYERRAFLTETVPIKPITALQGLNNLYSDGGGETAVVISPYA